MVCHAYLAERPSRGLRLNQLALAVSHIVAPCAA
jgi:hypothetical protein